MIRSALAQVRGRVQGVGFRYSALNAARSLGLRGWVRNESDGSVTARFQGSEAEVEQFIEWLKKGPSFSSVQDVDVTDMNVDDSLSSFTVTY
jgi:acylphosphatase